MIGVRRSRARRSAGSRARPVRTGALLALVIAAGPISVACSSSPIPTCEGEPVLGTSFHATLRVGEGGCHFAADQGTASANGLETAFDFSAIVSRKGDGTALLCLQRAEAKPLSGTFTGDVLAVQGETVPAFVPAQACKCPLQLLETLNGSFTHRVDGSVDFAGELVNVMSAQAGVDPATCEPAPTDSSGPKCGVPCELHWTVTGAR